MKHLIKFDLAKKICFNTIYKIKKIFIPVKKATYYILAQNCRSKIDLPNENTSSKDGFAVKSSQTKNVSVSNPLSLKIVGTVYAGDINNKIKNIPVEPNSCIKIMTGAILPKHFDAVIPIEFVKEDNKFIKIFSPTKKWDNVRKKSIQLKKNELLFVKGTILRPQEVGVLISAGFNKVLVYQKPEIGIITTGNEIVEIDKPLKLGQVRNVNSYILQSLLQKYSFNYINYGLVKDNFKDLKSKILTAIKQCDVVLISGGISHGEYDLVKPVLKSLGVKQLFWEIMCRPAKPLFFGIKNFNSKKKFVFGIPGNTISNFVIFEVLIKPFLIKLAGNYNFKEKIFSAILTKNIKNKELGYKYFLRGKYVFKNNKFYVSPIKNQDSSVLKSIAKSNCLIILNEQYIDLKKGNIVKIQLLD